MLVWFLVGSMVYGVRGGGVGGARAADLQNVDDLVPCTLVVTAVPLKPPMEIRRKFDCAHRASILRSKIDARLGGRLAVIIRAFFYFFVWGSS